MQVAMEREATLFIDGLSEEGAWVLEDHTTEVVTQWDDYHGYGFGAMIISGDATIHLTGGTYLLQSLPPGVTPDLPTGMPEMPSRDRDRSQTRSYY